MIVRPEDVVCVIGSGVTQTIADLAKEMYGSADAGDALYAYNDLSFSKDQPIPYGTSLIAPYTLHGTLFEIKKGSIKVDVFILRPRITDLQWKTKEIAAYDGTNDPAMFVEVSGKTVSCPDQTAATFELYQYDSNGNHTLIDSNPSCKIIKNELAGADGKPLKLWFEWHTTMYDRDRPYYFGKLIVDKSEFVMPQKKESMLRLKQYDYLVNDPAANFGATAKDECAQIKSIKEPKSSFWDIFLKKDYPAGHFFNMKDGKKNGTAGMKSSYLDTIGKGIVYHNYLSSHGTAFCSCNGTNNMVREFSEITGTDGVVEWLCPVCRKNAAAVGAFCFENNTYVELKDVLPLVHGPKLLLTASCCLTAITATYPNAWLTKGLRWYIGWAVPVAFSAAYNFAKSFYSTWCNKYAMNPDKVKDVFDAVSGNYWKYRPRLFGK